ncbi:hypothetical protein TcasGA2_TC012790 [Tribolium castaneum]|uniref:Uncharacterized protein n=1 Tax=Tribolium castaneum TaxID=7070 RepID=D6X0F4_TRICA|nr:hypothetical protein TcasGA2_TC012790 [Tribolium castaneum]
MDRNSMRLTLRIRRTERGAPVIACYETPPRIEGGPRLDLYLIARPANARLDRAPPETDRPPRRR